MKQNITKLMLILLTLNACISVPPLSKKPDYSTPEKTLLTFYNAFQNDEIDREYECFSNELKRKHNLDLSIYSDIREQYEDEESWLTLQVLNKIDLAEHIIDIVINDNIALIHLMINGIERRIQLTKKYGFHIITNEDGSYSDLISEPINSIVVVRNNVLTAEIPLLSKRQSKLVRDKIQKVSCFIIEEQWKINDIPEVYQALTN